jgi:hypothetical protein
LKVTPFRSFFSTASGFGTISLAGRTVSIRIVEGELPIEKLVFSEAETTHTLDWKTTARPNALATKTI